MAVFNLLNWSGWPWAGGDGRAKISGRDGEKTAPRVRSIDEHGALQIGAVWSCTRLLSETIGALPLGVYSRDAKGAKAPATVDPLYALLHDSPNADQTAAEFWEAAVACLCLWGNFYAEKKRNGVGQIVALNVLRPALVSVRRNASGARVYRLNGASGARELGEDDVFHIRGFGVGGDVGLSPIGYARRTLNLALDTEAAAQASWDNGVKGSGFLVVPGKPTPTQKDDLRKTFLDPITGAEATGKAGILEAGMDWKQIVGIPPEQLQLLESRAFNVEEICRWFRVPPFMIGHTEKSTSWGTGLEQQMIGFLTFSLRPYLTRIEQAVKKQLIAPANRATLFVEFNLEGLLRADSQGRAALYASAAQNGWMTRNEIRALENRPRVDGGDDLTVQSNLLPVDKLGGGAAGPAEQVRASLLDWLTPKSGDAP